MDGGPPLTLVEKWPYQGLQRPAAPACQSEKTALGL